MITIIKYPNRKLYLQGHGETHGVRLGRYTTLPILDQLSSRDLPFRVVKSRGFEDITKETLITRYFQKKKQELMGQSLEELRGHVQSV